jgi:RNA polymerase sigma-70 factor, ECF subfamily
MTFAAISHQSSAGRGLAGSIKLRENTNDPNHQMQNDHDREPDFMRLFVAHERQLRAFARTLLPTWEAVEDVLQESSVVMWKKLDQLEDDSGFLPWAKVIVRFEALRARRRVARDRLVLSEETIALLAEEALEMPNDILQRERDALTRCLQKLSDEHRKLVLMPYVETGGLLEVAKRTQRSANSLYKLLGRLREKLKLCVEHELDLAGERGTP